ncbi:hypothetical protein [Okeania sp. KiyG1]|uniref:hypothetical protein n=1 Tax=Okeania sp. KiyG1 TaxID=2720165 RepID=UPI00192119C6|nr:hypothetical protein [Okeania sp. KiyG1]
MEQLITSHFSYQLSVISYQLTVPPLIAIPDKKLLKTLWGEGEQGRREKES